tara:strand:- start:1914 stop:4094 length:2181 start_codon:yes stop_codon:yes gene_type:complete
MAGPGWTLEALYRPPAETARLPAMTGAQAKDLLTELHDEWFDLSVPFTDLASWSLARLGLAADGGFSKDDFEVAYTRRLLQFKQLIHQIKLVGADEDDGDVVDMGRDIQKMLAATYRLIFAAFIQFSRMEPTRALKIQRLPEVVDDEESFLYNRNDESLTSFQRLLLFTLEHFEAKKFRKCADACFQRVITRQGVATPAYEFASTIKDEVWRLRKETHWKMWKLFTNPRDNPRAVTEHLVESKQEEFPEYDVGEGHWYSFENCVYNIRWDAAFFYGEETLWPEQSRAYQERKGIRFGMEWELVACAKDDAVFVRDANLETILLQTVRLTRNQWIELTLHELPEHAHVNVAVGEDAMLVFRALPSEELPRVPFPSPETVCVNHIPVLFRFNPLTEEEAFDPLTIKTTAMDKIFQHQRFTADTRAWNYVMIGRMFFPVNVFEKWSRALVYQGAGGTGKSTLANWFMRTLPAHFHSIANSNFEEQFGMSGITGDEKRACLMTEMTDDVKWKQEEWQICVEGGTVQVATKGLTSKAHHFKQHIWMMGNQFPRRWKNNGRQVSRRVWLCIFSYLVDKGTVNTNLLDELVSETDAILRKMTSCYMHVARESGHKDLEAPGLMPDQVREMMASMDASIDPLTSFVLSDQLLKGDDCFMPLDDFRVAYFDYRKSNGLDRAAWTVDHYGTTFQALGLTYETARSTRLYNLGEQTVIWINGVTPPRNGSRMQTEQA